MKNAVGSLLILWTSLLAGTAIGQAQSFNPGDAHYVWPTEASPYLTATFAETRSSHFHAAVDIKTWGRRGYEIYATRDGIVDRIAIGPRGYGKVIYLKHKDGSYSVYAHLLSFNEQLQQFVDSIRLDEGYKFEIERFIGSKNIEVEQGDVIGYSGASGIGPPHLHFELRTPTHKPFNPLFTNLKVEDNIAPEILGVAVEPLSPKSSVEGNNDIYIKKTTSDVRPYDLGTIQTSGPIGLAVNVFDQSNDVNNVYAVYELSLSVNGQQLFKTRADSFSYGVSSHMFLDRIYPLLQRTDESYQRLFRVDGNRLPFYETSTSEGRLNLPQGNHTVTIRASDYYGNSSEASFELEVVKNGPKSSPPPKSQITDGTPPLQPHYWSWFPNWLSLRNNQFRRVTMASDSSEFTTHQNSVTVNLKGQDNLFLNIPGTGPITLRRIVPESEQIVSSSGRQGFAIFPRHTFHDTVSVGMAVEKQAPDIIDVEIIPEAYPMRGDYRFYVPRDSNLTDISKLAFYKWDRFDDDEQWELLSTTFSDDFIISNAESMGTFSLKRDTTAPKLSNPRLRQRPDDKWVIIIDATDNLSGIDYYSTRILVNGNRGIPEYAPEDDRFIYYHPDFEPTDSMKVDITAFDKMGNKRSISFFMDSSEE